MRLQKEYSELLKLLPGGEISSNNEIRDVPIEKTSEEIKRLRKNIFELRNKLRNKGFVNIDDLSEDDLQN